MDSKGLSPMVSPDGGWGWMVCFACVLNNIIAVPLVTGIGLIFQEIFIKFGISRLWAQVIVNLNPAFAIAFSIYDQKFLEGCGYRKVASIGAMLISIGIVVTSVANTTIYFIITYSLMTGIGLSMTTSSFTHALNSYFYKKRKLARNINLFFSGLGPIIMPHLMAVLYLTYGAKDGIIILAALSLNSLAAALILRPIKWYLKPKNVTQNNDLKSHLIQIHHVEPPDEFSSEDLSKIMDATESEDDYLDNRSNLDISLNSLHSNANLNASIEICSKLTSSSISSSIAGNEKIPYKKNDESSKWWDCNSISSNTPSNKEAKVTEAKQDDEDKKNLFKSGKFLSVVLGTSLAISCEISFYVAMPFLLRDLNLSIVENAIILSVICGAEFLFKMTSPFIGSWCHKSAKMMYFCSLCMLIFTRSVFIIATSYEIIILIAVCYGMTKGVNSAYESRVIPEQMSSKTIRATSSVQKIATAILLTVLAPILGYARHESGSYDNSILIVNVLTAATVLLWIFEFVYVQITAK